jgi:hypothetical protein
MGVSRFKECSSTEGARSQGELHRIMVLMTLIYAPPGCCSQPEAAPTVRDFTSVVVVVAVVPALCRNLSSAYLHGAYGPACCE